MDRMKWTALAFVGALACGSTQPTPAAPAPAPAAPTLDQMVDAMCACKTPACADQVRTQFPGVDKPGDTTPHVAALHATLGGCESTAREGDEVTMLGKMEDAMCACKDGACVDGVQKEYKPFMAREDEKYRGDTKPSAQLLKMAEHMQECAVRAYEASGDKPANGTGLDHTAGNWHPAPPPGSDSAGEGGTGVPECDAYLRAVDRYLQCDKIPQEARDAMKDSIEQQREAFRAAGSAAADGCREASDAIKQTADAVGCPL